MTAGTPQETEVGLVSHYYGHLGVMAVELTDRLHVGDKLHIKGHSEDFVMTVDSMQIEHKDVAQAKSGDSVGIRVPQKVHPGDKIYRTT
jgi:translation elongation factor EF-1alpha